MNKGQLIYEGKAKKLFQVLDANGAVQPARVWIEYKNSLTAFNALKKGEFSGKGAINLRISKVLFSALEAAGLRTHWREIINDSEMIAEQVQIIPLEVVVRNILAGSTAKKMGRPEGETLPRPLVEFYFKNDELADPFMSDDQIIVFNIASETQIRDLKAKALQVNEVLIKLFKNARIQLVDFKIEFGTNSRGELILADEISPDCMRLWDLESGEKLDKDRFRRDLGNVKESYEEVLRRIEK